jgi:NRAMP (natural resistance-associated macrophage protein)-like metal ion transporter
MFLKKKIKYLIKVAGPGLVSGAADDDPSGIATYTQTGAKFGYSQLWTAGFILPFLIATQEVCARIGVATGKGIARLVKENYSKKTLFVVVGLVLIANTINIGADIGAMAAAFNLLVPLPFALTALGFTAIILVLEVFTSYKTYARILKWLAFSLIAYLITVFIVKEPWLVILKATFIPNIKLDFGFIFLITALFGTTISPYVFFWETSQEVEEEKEHGTVASNSYIKRIRADNALGMIASQIATWSVIVVAATVLHNAGITNINSAADAARALEPLVATFPNAGLLAKAIFSLGIIGLGLLAIPVLSASASFALSEAFGWREGFNLKLKRGKEFYGIIVASVLIGLTMNLIGIDPVKALIYAAVINAVVAVPLLFIIARIANNPKIMGEYKSSRLSNIFVYSTVGVMAVSVLAMAITFLGS